MLAGGEQSRAGMRQTAMLPAKMLDSRTTRSVRVDDLSPKGMLVVSDHPPSRGEFVQIKIGGYELAGQVRWVEGRRFGLRTQERIDVHGILSGKGGNKRVAGKKIVESNDPDDWPLQKLVIAYGLLALSAFASAYLLVTYFIL